MANVNRGKVRSIFTEYYFDRLQLVKLQQAYELLVPDCVRLIPSESSKLTRSRHEGSIDLCEGFIGQAKGGEHHCESDSGPTSICQAKKLQRS